MISYGRHFNNKICGGAIVNRRDLVNCMVALPGQLFYSTHIPVCLWFLAKNKASDAKRGFRDRRKQTLLIVTQKMGAPIKEFSSVDYKNISLAFAAYLTINTHSPETTLRYGLI